MNNKKTIQVILVDPFDQSLSFIDISESNLQDYYKAMGKSPYKVAPHVYKEMGIYSIQDLLEHRENNPWSKVDL